MSISIIETHCQRIQKGNGKRIPEFFSKLGIPRGWVVDADRLTEIDDLVKAHVVPLKPGGINIFAKRIAENKLLELNARFSVDRNDEVFLLAVPDNETFGIGWSVRPVILSDLSRDPEYILNEGFDAIRTNNFQLSDMKRCAFMAITGATNTK